MQLRVQKHVVVAWIGLIAHLARGGSAPATSELLDKYTQALQSTQSFISKTEVLTRQDYQFDPYFDPAWMGTTNAIDRRGLEVHAQVEFRTDGQRTRRIQYSWGDLSLREPPTDKAQPSFFFSNWDGVDYYVHASVAKNPSKRGVVQLGGLQKGQETTQFIRHSESCLLGYPGDERVDVMLRRAASVSVSDRMETINGAACHVITGRTNDGTVSLWIAPQYGYNAVQMEVKSVSGDPQRPEVMRTTRFENVRFQQMDGAWIPMEADTIHETTFNIKGRKGFMRDASHCKRTEFVLNPDHNALGSFDDPLKGDPELLDGTPIYKLGTPFRFRWEGGQVVPDTDQAAVAELDKMAKDLLSEGKIPATLAPDQTAAPTVPTPVLLLDRYAQTQDRLQSLLAEGDSTTHRTAASGESVGTEVSHHCLKTSGERVSHRVSFYDGVLTTQEKPGYRSFVYDGQRLIQYRKGLDRRNDRVFVANSAGGKTRLLITEYKGAPLLGFCPGDLERFDRILRSAKELSVSTDQQAAGDLQCPILEGQTERGRYRVWIDTEHDYHFARLRVERQAGDVIQDSPYGAKSMSFSVDNVRFQQIDEVWVPMEADMQLTTDGPPQTVQWHYQRTRVVLNPDHDALKSFFPDDIPEDTKVQMADEPSVEYVWRKGSPVKEVKNHEAR
jgi:hypothetical protein